jgi:hypothetical protein
LNRLAEASKESYGWKVIAANEGRVTKQSNLAWAAANRLAA